MRRKRMFYEREDRGTLGKARMNSHSSRGHIHGLVALQDDVEKDSWRPPRAGRFLLSFPKKLPLLREQWAPLFP
jgi:hypothetical protein